ncbi:MAG: preprotein translocase subunit YajC [Phycisphaerales bacterium]
MEGLLLPNSLPSTHLTSLSTILAYQDASPLAGETPAGGGATTGQGAAGSQGGANPPATQSGSQGFDPILILMLGMGVFLVVMIFTSGRRQKREQRERQGMLDALKRNDKVQTIGGIIGVVAEVRTDEVVLKVDDAGQNRVRFARSAIQQVISSRGGSNETETAAAEAETETETETQASNP